MGEFDLNLSTRPFPAYRVANAALGALLAVLIGVSVWQAYAFLRVSSAAGEIRSQEEQARVENEALAGRLRELESTLDRPEAAAQLAEIEYLNGLIARKSFSWTRVFAVLEDILPQSVHLTSIRPEISENGQTVLYAEVRGRSAADLGKFIQLLEASPMFGTPTVSVEQRKDDAGVEEDVSLTVTYLPEGESGGRTE